jgi:hypothetical protein
LVLYPGNMVDEVLLWTVYRKNYMFFWIIGLTLSISRKNRFHCGIPREGQSAFKSFAIITSQELADSSIDYCRSVDSFSVER